MLIINIESGNIEKALKKYKSKVIKTKQLNELRNRQEFEKPSSKKRTGLSKAKYLQKKKDLIDKD
jgi:small subunit ribosomal protein S21